VTVPTCETWNNIEFVSVCTRMIDNVNKYKLLNKYTSHGILVIFYLNFNRNNLHSCYQPNNGFANHEQ